MLNQTMRNILKESVALEELIIENDGQICETLENWMQINENNIAQKVDGYYYLIARLEKSAEYFNERSKEFYNAKKTCDNQIDRLKSNLKFTMQNSGIEELVGTDVKFKLSKAKPKVNINNENLIPREYAREKIIVEIDKDAIRSSIDIGIEVSGASLEKSFSLRSYLIKKGL